MRQDDMGSGDSGTAIHETTFRKADPGVATVSESKKIKICFVAHLAYGALAGGSSGHPGGVERQTSLMARWLAARGFEVSMLTWDEGQPQNQIVDGVRVIKMCGLNDGFRGLRFFHPRWTSLNAAMAQADADIYYQNCAEYVTGQVALWCRRRGRRFVYSVASDPDCDVRLPALRAQRERILYRYGMRHADSVIVQTLTQQQMLRDGFGVDSRPIPMPCPGPSHEEFRYPSPPGPGPRVLWVGRLTAVKRFEWLLEAAAQLPEVTFDVAGPVVQMDTDKISRELLDQAHSLPNVILHGHVARTKLPELYSQASLLLCTSHFEGFPNVFLEAWSYGVPIVSTVDPDGIIKRRGLGATASTADSLTVEIRRMIADKVLWTTCSRSARTYYAENHMFEPVMRQFENVFVGLAGSKPGVAERWKTAFLE